MAKDPAFLFYPGDWMGGTATFNRHLKGCYIDLLMAQFNSGPLSLEEIKTVLASDFGTAWPALQKKFVAKNGLFFNERLESEKTKRAEYSKSRSENRKRKQTHDLSYKKDVIEHKENEDENKNGIEIKVGGPGEGAKPNTWKVTYPFPSQEFAAAWALWKEHLKGHKKPFHTFSSEQVAVDSLKKYDEQRAIEIIKQCITNNWKTLIETEYKNNGTKTKQPTQRPGGPGAF